MDDQKQVEKRLGWLACVILVWGAIILVRLVMFQVVHHRDYLRAARKAQEIQVKVPAIRGSIFDRNNRLLAMSTRLDTVFVNPQEVPNVAVASEILSRILNLDPGDLHKRLEAAVAKTGIPGRQDHDLAGRKRETARTPDAVDPPGSKTQRHYPKDTLGAHVIGFVNFEEQGSGGMEMSMEAVLRGQAGLERVLTDVKRRADRSACGQEAKDGVPLVLTIDERIQFVMERELARPCNTRKARPAAPWR